MVMTHKHKHFEISFSTHNLFIVLMCFAFFEDAIKLSKIKTTTKHNTSAGSFHSVQQMEHNLVFLVTFIVKNSSYYVFYLLG